MNIKTKLKQLQEELKLVSDAPRLDAERLLLHVLNKRNSSWLTAHEDAELSGEQQTVLAAAAAQRASGVPLAYILREQEFYGRSFAITEDVLVPRPETEALVETALRTIAVLARKLGRPLVVADIGTGSGCIAVTIALETGTDTVTKVIATDASERALEEAKRNAKRHGVTEVVRFKQGDMLDPLEGLEIDLIVSNPPYVPSPELDALQDTVRPETAGLLHEPRMALDGGIDGQRYLNIIRASGVPCVLEGIGGKVEVANLEPGY